MHLTAHIIGTHETPIAALCDQLLAQDIIATHPATDEFFNTGAWSKYEIDLSNYECTTASNILIVCNKSPLTTTLAQQICYALSKNKPVVLTSMLAFEPEADRNLADIIMRHSRQLHTPKSPKNMGDFLLQLPREQHYNLSAREQLRVAISCRSYFRQLIQSTPASLQPTANAL
jgi:hypothetical protein